MEVKIGVQNVAREIVLESDQSAEEVEKLVDGRAGRRRARSASSTAAAAASIVPVAVLGYVDIGVARKGSVGFGTI